MQVDGNQRMNTQLRDRGQDAHLDSNRSKISAKITFPIPGNAEHENRSPNDETQVRVSTDEGRENQCRSKTDH
jgi:hypothetical protein